MTARRFAALTGLAVMLTLACPDLASLLGQSRPPAPARPHVDADGNPLPAGALARLGTTRLRHAGPVAYLALSPDGALLATGNYFPEATVQVSETATGKRVLHRAAPDAFNVMAMAFSPDGQSLALSGQGINNDYARIYLWAVPGGRELRRFPLPVNHRPFRWLAAFAPDGKTLATGCDKIYLLDAATGALRHTLITGKNHATALAFSPDGGLLATADEDGSLCLWEPRTGKRLAVLQTDLVYTLAFGPDGSLLVGAGPGRPVRLWQIKRDSAASRLVLQPPPEGHEGGAEALAFARSGRLLAAGGTDSAAWIWDTATRKRLRSRNWAAVHAQAAGFDAAGRALVVGVAPQANGARVLDVVSGRELLDGAAHHDAVHRLAFSPDGKTLASLDQAGVLRLWQSPGGHPLDRPDLPKPEVNEIAFTARGQLLTSAGGRLYRIDRPGSKATPIVPGAPKGAGHTLSPDGSRLALQQAFPPKPEAGQKVSSFIEPRPVPHRVSLWDVAAGTELRRLPALTATRLTCMMSPDGRVLATGTHELSLWDTTTGRLLHRLPVETPWIAVLAFHPRGRVVAVREPNAISLWEVASGQRIRNWSLVQRERLAFNHDAEKQLAFSPDGRLLATDLYRGPIHFWDVGTGQLVHTLAGSGGPASALAFAPDGKVLATGHADSSVLLWDVTGARPHSAAALKPLTAADYGKLWEQLADTRASAAYAALATLAAAGEPAAVWLRGRLKPATPFDARRIEQLIRDLSDTRFATRERAMSELESLGAPAAEALRQALKDSPPLEMQRRAEQVLKRLKRRAPEELRALRAVDALEQIGTPAARAVLRTLAGGAPGARLTQEARASLQRLGGE